MIHHRPEGRCTLTQNDGECHWFPLSLSLCGHTQYNRYLGGEITKKQEKNQKTIDNVEPEKHDSPFQRKKNNMPANKSIQARQQLRDPNTGRFRDEHRQSGMPTDESIRKYEQQPRPPLPPPTEVPLPPAKARQASSRTIPVDGRPGSTLTVQDVPDQTHGMKRHTQFQSPTTSIRLETPISKNINLPKMEKVADDLETWRTRSNEKRGEYDAPIARMEASGTGLNRLTVRPVFGTPPRRPWQPWKWKAWQKARERESLASNGFDYIHN